MKAFLALCLLHFAFLFTTSSNAQSFLERGKASYESMTPSQQKVLREQVEAGGQIRIEPQSLTRTGNGSSSLLFLKGLSCREWNGTAIVVRTNWLNQYSDLLISSDYNPIRSTPSLALTRIDEQCQGNPSSLVELAIAAAFRKLETEAIIGRENFQRQMNEAATARAAEMAAKLASQRAQGQIEINRILDGQSDGFSCKKWSKFDIYARLWWVKQYKTAKVSDASMFKDEVQELRMQRICKSYPEIMVSKALAFIFGVSTDDDSEKTSSNSGQLESISKPAMISWKRGLQDNAEIDDVKIDNRIVSSKKEFAEILPGFHTIQYMCKWARRKSNYESLDLYVNPGMEYSMLVTSHGKDEFSKMTSMEINSRYPKEYASDVHNFCSARIAECDGITYTSGGAISCVKEKVGFFNNQLRVMD